jgi:hypothetical protein
MSDGFVRAASVRPDSLVNFVSIQVVANPSEPTPTLQVVQDANSQNIYGVQSITLDSLLATNADAEILADYLIRPDPNYWFTGLRVNMLRLSTPQRLAVTQLEIGSFIGVIKSFKYGSPSIVAKNLYVEGIEHTITTSNHYVDLFFSPVGFYEEWQEVTADLAWEDVNTGLAWTNLIWTTL